MWYLRISVFMVFTVTVKGTVKRYTNQEWVPPMIKLRKAPGSKIKSSRAFSILDIVGEEQKHNFVWSKTQLTMTNSLYVQHI